LAKEVTVYAPGEDDVKTNRQREAARVMYDALRRIAEADAFFDGEKRLKKIAAGALREVERLSREQ
jgi:hypothetical protein